MSSTTLTNLDQTLFNELKNTTKIVIIDFWATWCPPCKVMGPIFEGFEKDTDFADYEIVQCDVDNNPEVSDQFKISSIPTFSVVKFKGDGSFGLDTHKVGEVVGSMESLSFKKALLELAEKAKSM
ncbi:MAG: thioredoxin family protein [Patescibacteria group bacterium]